jgi:neutral ceramidase
MAALGGDYAKYKDANIAVVGTHSHSGPGGWNNYVLPLVPALGWNQQNYETVVKGSVLALKRAHDSLTLGTIDVGTADVQDGNINRSLWSYMNNPQSEQDQYGSSTDKTTTLMRLKRQDGKAIGLLNWYAVHPTSAYNNNTLVTGDNKGD